MVQEVCVNFPRKREAVFIEVQITLLPCITGAQWTVNVFERKEVAFWKGNEVKIKGGFFWQNLELTHLGSTTQLCL